METKGSSEPLIAGPFAGNPIVSGGFSSQRAGTAEKTFSSHGPLARYVKLRVAHAPGMPGTFSPLPWFSDPAMHHGPCVTHVPWYMAGSLTNGFLWSQWRGKRPRHSWRMRNPQVCISGKRPMKSSWNNRICGRHVYIYHSRKKHISLRDAGNVFVCIFHIYRQY